MKEIMNASYKINTVNQSTTYDSPTAKKMPTINEITVQKMLKAILVPFNPLLVGCFDEQTPMIPVIAINNPNQIPLPLLLTQ